MIRNCYPTVASSIWEIFSEFLIFCNLLHEPLGEYITAKYENRGKYLPKLHEHAITTLSLNAYLKKIYQELSYLLIVSGLLNII